MTEKRFVQVYLDLDCFNGCWNCKHDKSICEINNIGTVGYVKGISHCALKDWEFNGNFKAENSFLKIIDDYYIKYGDEGELFSMHKPSDIRSLIRILNRDNGYSELQCEYNNLERGEDD